jgi:pentatricopeptide repeat protein
LLYRAWQLFDWVRSLPEGHALQGLCDSNTYTTMITLCGPWQQLRRALQLIADMRSRNIECGVLVRVPTALWRPGWTSLLLMRQLRKMHMP